MIRPLSLTAAILVPEVASSEARLFDCSFDQICSAEDGCRSETMEFRFQFDDITGEAFIVGNAGVSAVSAYVGDQGVTFLEALGTGAVQSTTITTTGHATHSRHTILGGRLVPSQYYGNCIEGAGN